MAIKDSNKRVQVVISKELYEKLLADALLNGMSLSKYLRLLISNKN